MITDPKDGGKILSKGGWLLLMLSRRLWFRAALISLLAVAAALVSLLISPYLPDGLSAKIGADAVDSILSIIATSMLTVTTFSLSTAVSAYGAATSNVTPRATKLLIEDTTTQNVLATFVGSFLYSLVAIITLSMGAYGERGRVVLFAVTILVILLIVVTLLRWIDYLLKLGRVGETTKAVEDAATSAMRARHLRPCLGGKRLADADDAFPPDAASVFSKHIGYVQHVDLGAIASCAKKAGGEVFLRALPGTFVDRSRPVALCAGFAEASELAVVRDAFTIEAERSFDQDPRFGISVLAEIASRALSPAVNDAGTAIDVIGRAVRVLTIWTEKVEREEPLYPEVHVPEVTVEELFDDVFSPIARDGAGNVEVQIRLQKAFAALIRTGDQRFIDNAQRHSAIALKRALETLQFEEDRRRVRNAADTLNQ